MLAIKIFKGKTLKEIHNMIRKERCMSRRYRLALWIRDSAIFFSEDQRSYRKCIVSVYYRQYNHLEDIDIVQSQIRKSKCSVIFQNGGIHILRYLLKDVSC